MICYQRMRSERERYRERYQGVNTKKDSSFTCLLNECFFSFAVAKHKHEMIEGY